MNLHCSQTSLQPIRPPKSLIPYEFALLSNRLKDFKHTYKFDSPTNLHCSQTTKIKRNWPLPFDSPTNLHCSQTGIKIVPQARSLIPLRLCTALKPVGISSIFFIVWFPYEFALLSNPVQHGQLQLLVWFPYEFALLSNKRRYNANKTIVWFPYEFALLSNCWMISNTATIVWFPYEFALLSNLKCLK